MRTAASESLSATLVDLYGRVPPLSKQPPKTALCAVPAITLKLFVVIIRAINRQKARYLWLFASKWQSTVQVDFSWHFKTRAHGSESNKK